MATKLEDAVAIVQKGIHKWREKYESVANENEQDHLIMVEGETTAGYFCRLRLCTLSGSQRRYTGRNVGRFRSKVWLRACLLGGSIIIIICWPTVYNS